LKPWSADEVDVRALAAVDDAAVAAAQRLAEVAVDDVGAGELADGDAPGVRVEHLLRAGSRAPR
jgi:hypothetical protein